MPGSLLQLPPKSTEDSSDDSLTTQTDDGNCVREPAKPSDLLKVAPLNMSLLSSNYANNNFYDDALNSFRPFEVVTNLYANDNLFRKNLELYLSTDFKALIKAEHNFFQKDQQIIISEPTLIHECIMLLSGIKQSLLFQYSDGNYFLNKKFRLRHLNKELDDCLKDVKHYAGIVLKVEEFIRSCTKSPEKSTQIYEAFAQSLTEYLKCYKVFLNHMGTVLVKKEDKFTLIDFMIQVKRPHFPLLDLVNSLLEQIEHDAVLEAHKKSTNLLGLMHQLSVNSFNRHNVVCLEAKFLVWLLVRSLRPYFFLIDTFIREGTHLDVRQELGFKRHKHVKVDDPAYWSSGYEMLDEFKLTSDFNEVSMIFTPKAAPSDLPKFILNILNSAYKIFKHTEIVKLLNIFDGADSNIWEQFIGQIKSICPFLAPKSDQDEHEVGLWPTSEQSEQRYKTLLDINFNQLENLNRRLRQCSKPPCNSLVSIEILLRESDYEEKHVARRDLFKIDFILEKRLDAILNDTLVKYANHCSNTLISNLFDKYRMDKYFEFIHSHYLFKSNEVVFIFSKMLFDAIRSYEIYQEDAILNSLYYKSANMVLAYYTQKNTFSPKLISFTYENPMAMTALLTASSLSTSFMQTSLLAAHPTQMSNFNTTSRLISSIKLNVKQIWPLNILINQLDFEKYNRIFLFLMQIKQVKYELDTLDLKDMDIKRFSANQGAGRPVVPDDKSTASIDQFALNKMLFIRFKLMNFINNFHDSICNQIYEANDEFLRKLKAQTDIDDMIKLHELFILRTIKNYLIPNRPFQTCLLSIFNMILSFCDLWHRGIFYFTEAVRETLVELERNINDYLDFIHKLLSAILNKYPLVHFQSLMAAIEK